MPSPTNPLWHPLDLAFDAAVIAITKALLPEGFDTAPDAPSSYEQLTMWLDAGHRMRVWSGASEHTIFGSPTTNAHFRAWHDWLHWHHKLPFTLPGETSIALLQAAEIVRRAPDPQQALLWRALIYSEVIGQALYADLLGRFPGNQRRFTRHFLELFLERQASVPGQYEQLSDFNPRNKE